MQSKNNPLLFLGLLLIVVGLIVWGIFGEITISSGLLMAVGGIGLLVYVFTNVNYLIEALTGRTAYEGANMAVGIVVCLVIVVIAYLMLDRYNTTFDFTEAKKFSLSEYTENLLRNLEEPVTLQYLIDPQGAAGSTRAENLMELYSDYSSNIETQSIDPERNPLQVRELGDAVTYGALYVRKGDQHEKVSPINENNLTNAILKITQEQTRTVYFVTGHGEPDIQSREAEGLYAMRALLEDEGYQVNALQLAQEEEVPDDAAVVIIADPNSPYFETEIETLQRYLEGGGDAIFLLDPGANSGLEPMLEENYGVRLGEYYVLEYNPVAQILGGDPTAPIMSSMGTHPITEAFGGTARSVAFPTVRSVKKTEQPPAGMEVTELIFTSQDSWEETDIQTMTEQGTAQFDPNQDQEGPVSIAAAVSQPVESVDDATPDSDPQSDLEALAAGDEEDGDVQEADSANEMRLVIYGDGDFIKNSNYQFSTDLFVNTVNWLTEQEDLISIRAKDDAGQPIQVSSFQGRLAFYGSVVILPGLVALLGAVVLVLRKLSA